jgi:endoglucanase
MVTRRTATALLLSALAPPSLAAGAQSVTVPTRGFNLPDWLTFEPRVPAAGTLEMLRGLGFETIRLPADPDFLLSGGAGAATATALRTATDSGFNVIVNMVPAGSVDFDDDFPADASRVEDAWRLLASILADTSPANVYPELLNEPPMSAEAWHPLRDRLADIVRAACPDHTLVWGPGWVQGIWEVDSVPPLPDGNAIVAVHYYTPMGFTHQCQNWDPASPLERIRNLPFPATRNSPEVAALTAAFEAAADLDGLDYLDGEFKGAWSVERIDDDFAGLAQWSRSRNTPVMLNEFGVLNFCVDAASRATWVRAVRRAAERHGIGWTYWEADQGFGFISDRGPDGDVDPAMIEALLA